MDPPSVSDARITKQPGRETPTSCMRRRDGIKHRIARTLLRGIRRARSYRQYATSIEPRTQANASVLKEATPMLKSLDLIFPDICTLLVFNNVSGSLEHLDLKCEIILSDLVLLTFS